MNPLEVAQTQVDTPEPSNRQEAARSSSRHGMPNPRVTVHANSSSGERCRLCGSDLIAKFDCMVLGRHNVQYFECVQCTSLQTEIPFWLTEAYAHGNLSSLDTGAAQRNLSNFVASYVTAKILGLRTALDYGGGDGLLCRLLRDYGLDCYVSDKHSLPKYAQGYSEPSFDVPDLVTAFEVIEHFANPQTELESLFAHRPRVVLATTGIYEGQHRDWWYLAPESGQHVFFYSNAALSLIAQRYGYRLVRCGGYVLFARSEASWRLALVRFLFTRRISRGLRILLALLPAHGAWTDHETQVSAAQRGRP